MNIEFDSGEHIDIVNCGNCGGNITVDYGNWDGSYRIKKCSKCGKIVDIEKKLADIVRYSIKKY